MGAPQLETERLRLEPARLADAPALHALWAAHQGNGYATEDARALLDHACRALGAARVVAGTDPPNVASLRAMERLGMHFLEERRMGDIVAVYHCISREHHAQTLRPIG